MERAVDRLFVTGTDTGVGKTVVSAALLHAFRAHGRRAVGMKPVASGCERAPEGWRNEDALALQAASDPLPRRLAALRAEIVALLEEFEPQVVAVEQHRLG